MERYFPTIYRNDGLRCRLGREILENRFPHACIIAGKKGSGKHTLAINIAAALACENENQIPCGMCDSCTKIFAGFSPDVIYIRKDPEKKEFSVNLIREIKDSIFIAPNELKKRVYIIEEAETMNQNAQNAFLKILEEPPRYVVFLLLCSDTQSLLETVKSRAPILNTEYISPDDLRDFLLNYSSRAKDIFNSDPERLNSIILSADGSIGVALSLCEDCEKQGIIRESVFSFLNAWISPNLLELDLFCDVLATGSVDFANFLHNLKIALRDITVLKLHAESHLLFFNNYIEADTFVSRITSKKALKLISISNILIDKLKFYIDVRLAAVTFCSDARKIIIE